MTYCFCPTPFEETDNLCHHCHKPIRTDFWKEATDWVREEFDREKEKELQDIFAAKEPVDNANAVQYKQKGEER